jgi:DNA-binding NarL/FixJ family response regulator
MDTINILLVDDHRVVREGLRRMLELESDFRVVGEASDAQTVIAQVGELTPEVVLMDIKMPGGDGISLTRRLKEEYPECNVIMLTLYDEYLTQAIEAGATGYLLKDIEREELIKAIRGIHDGRSTLNLSLDRDQLQDLISQTNEKQRSNLTERELNILRMIAEGITTRDIAEQLFLSQASVKRSVRIIFEKLNAHNRSGAVAEAYKRRLI